MFKLFKRACKKMIDSQVELAKVKKECFIEIVNDKKCQDFINNSFIGLGIGLVIIGVLNKINK